MLHTGPVVLGGAHDGTVVLWDAASRTQIKHVQTHSAEVNSLVLVFHRIVWSACSDKSICAWV